MTTKRLPDGIDQLKSGKYRARYRDGSGQQFSKSFERMSDAKDWRIQQVSGVKAGVHVAPSHVTVSEAAVQWSENRPYRASSRRQVTTYLNQLAATPLGKRPIASVKPSDIQAWVSNRSAVLAPQTTRNLYTWLKAVFASAVEDGLIGRSPCTSKTSLPALESADLVPLSREQVERLSEAVDGRYSAAIIVQAALGLRASELLGLQVRDVDFLRRQVKIERQLLRDGAGFGPPKTAKSRRTVPLAVDVVPVLSEHIRKFPPNDDGVIFTSTYGNPIRMNRWSAYIFKPAVAKAGLPEGTSSHDLRHHFAAVLLRRGVPVNVVARYLGHASAALVLSTYSRLMPDSDDLVRNTLDSVWSVTAESQTIEDDSASSV